MSGTVNALDLFKTTCGLVRIYWPLCGSLYKHSGRSVVHRGKHAVPANDYYCQHNNCDRICVLFACQICHPYLLNLTVCMLHHTIVITIYIISCFCHCWQHEVGFICLAKIHFRLSHIKQMICNICYDKLILSHGPVQSSFIQHGLGSSSVNPFKVAFLCISHVQGSK